MPRPRLEIPSTLDANRVTGPTWTRWLDALPALAADLLEEWQLTIDGGLLAGSCSLVLPVRTGAGAPAVLKVGLPHPEAEHESLALQHWKGVGAVRLMRADPHRFALLLERLHPEDLSDLWDVEACEIVASLYRRLHVPAPAPLRSLTSYVEGWTDALAALPSRTSLPRRLVEQAVAIGRDLGSDPATDGRMIHGDLHFANVLAADREPWLVIDPKPMSGDPHYEPASLLWNRWDEIVSAGDVRDGVRRRFHAVIDAAELDEDRARDWVVFRMMCNASWGLQEPEHPGHRSRHEDLTRCITVAKAVQD